MRKCLVLLMSIVLPLMLSLRYSVAQEDISIPPLPGRIAYIGADGNVYVVDPENNESLPLTDDAGAQRQYRWPTWSTDGRLAYFLTKVTGGNVETDVFVSTGRAGQLIYSGRDEVFTYAYWSPQNCDAGGDCRELAVLLSNLADQQFSVRLIRSNASDSASLDSLAGTGAPFYYSWSPDGDKMLWQRNNTSLDIYDANSNKLINTLPQRPGAFQAPAWSPADDRWLFGALSSDQQSTDLVVVGSEGTTTLASQLAGLVAFSWSPDGTKIAYMESGGTLFIVDARSGNVITRSPVSGVYAFFWSPDSQSIAYITLASAPGMLNAYTGEGEKVAALAQGAAELTWSVINVETGATHRYGTFMPTDEMIYLLGFFDQFSQSHRIWSPDSRYLIYGEITANRHQVISILDTSQTDSIPFSIAEGVIGIWNFGS